MSPRPAPASSDATALLDDFDWPPAADTVSVHEIEADPWPTSDVDDTDATDVIFEADAPPPAAPPSSPHTR
jgi:hypothetical protein